VPARSRPGSSSRPARAGANRGNLVQRQSKYDRKQGNEQDTLSLKRLSIGPQQQHRPAQHQRRAHARRIAIRNAGVKLGEAVDCRKQFRGEHRESSRSIEDRSGPIAYAKPTNGAICLHVRIPAASAPSRSRAGVTPRCSTTRSRATRISGSCRRTGRSLAPRRSILSPRAAEQDSCPSARKFHRTVHRAVAAAGAAGAAPGIAAAAAAMSAAGPASAAAGASAGAAAAPVSADRAAR
jgi:hypothetical protein